MKLSTLSYTHKTDTVLLILLGLFSFGGGSGRIIFGLGVFDVLLFVMLLISLSRLKRKEGTLDIKFLSILFILILLGILRAKLGVMNVSYEFFITELRFFLYIPILYFITLKIKFSIQVFEKLLPFIILFNVFIWLFLLRPGSFVYDFFNDDVIYTIGSHERIRGPSILILTPLLLLLINQKSIKPLIIILYLVLVLLIFIKTGGRTYFIYYLLPLLFLMYKRRKNKKLLVLYSILILISIFILKEITSSVFFERFLKVAQVTEDSSFMYRIFNIQEMLSRLKGDVLWLGNGIGSNYEVDLYGWKKSFFLDNTFITLIYKIGIIGLFGFLSIFWINKNIIPRDLYIFEICSILLIGVISYHLILNAVFIFGYFLIFNYFRHNCCLHTKNNGYRSN